MLNSKEVLSLKSCDVTNHAILSLDTLSLTPESLQIMERLKGGEIISESELFKLPTQSAVAEIKIKNNELLRELLQLCLKEGRDLQSLFGTDEHDYLSLFLNPKDDCVKEFFISRLKIIHPAFFEKWQHLSVDEITVSFPEINKSKIA